MGPILIFDKSTLQGLSLDEAVLLDQFFLANVTPLFYIETLADIEKAQRRSGSRTPEAIVADLARKTPLGGGPNVWHHTLAVSDLLGGTVSMVGSIVVSEGDRRRAPDGSIGLHIDGFPEAAMMQRWQAGQFSRVEREMASLWRSGLTQMNLDRILAWASEALMQDRRFSSLSDVRNFTKEFVHADASALEVCLRLLGIPEDSWTPVVERYKESGEPSLSTFAPYAAHVTEVDVFFLLSLLSSLISKDRPSNKVDLAYLYYLPFCMIFTSNDRLHERVTPLFLRDDQVFVSGKELKDGLRKLVGHFAGHMEQIEKEGLMRFAPTPPADIRTAVSDVWDRLVPKWRERPTERATPERSKTAEEIMRMSEVAQSAPGGIPDGNPDYVLIQRKLSVRRGRWRILPPEVEGGM